MVGIVFDQERSDGYSDAGRRNLYNVNCVLLVKEIFFYIDILLIKSNFQNKRIISFSEN